MSPEDLATRHPFLYHVTAPGAVANIRRHGLLSTSKLLDLFEVSPERRRDIEAGRRATSISVTHPAHGTATITDNRPLSMSALAACLEDDMTPQQWLRTLNERTFFWVDEDSVLRLLRATLNRSRKRDILVFDTLRLVTRCAGYVELCAINSGSTIRRPARRGRSTFVPLEQHSYQAWRRLRGRIDRIREVVVIGGVSNVGECLIEVRPMHGPEPLSTRGTTGG